MQGQSKSLDKVATIIPNLVARFRKQIDDLAVVRQHDVDKARGILRELLAREDDEQSGAYEEGHGRIVLHPTSDGTERYLTAHLRGDYTGLVRLAYGSKIKLVAVKRKKFYFGPKLRVPLQPAQHVSRQRLRTALK